jgi:hypothetical protein
MIKIRTLISASALKSALKRIKKKVLAATYMLKKWPVNTTIP